MDYQEKEKRRKARKLLGRCICLQEHQPRGPWEVVEFVEVDRCKSAKGICGLCGEVCIAQAHPLNKSNHMETCSIRSLLKSTLPTPTNTGLQGNSL